MKTNHDWQQNTKYPDWYRCTRCWAAKLQGETGVRYWEPELDAEPPCLPDEAEPVWHPSQLGEGWYFDASDPSTYVGDEQGRVSQAGVPLQPLQHVRCQGNMGDLVQPDPEHAPTVEDTFRRSWQEGLRYAQEIFDAEAEELEEDK